jgi:hypothetical protein
LLSAEVVTADGWFLKTSEEENEDLFWGLRGGGRIFCGRAAESSSDGSLLLYENLVAGLTARFLQVWGGLYAAGAYLGPIDIRLAVTGLEGAMSSTLSQSLTSRFSLQPYNRPECRRTERFLASTLRDDPRSAARKLVLPLTRAITRERYDPFSE